MDRSLKGSGAPKVTLTLLSPPVQGPRGGEGRGKPLPRGKRGCGIQDRGAPKPPVAQRAGGISIPIDAASPGNLENLGFGNTNLKL